MKPLKEPINLNDPLYNDEDWCYNKIKGTNNKTWSQIADYLKDKAKIFKEPSVLTILPINDGEILKILVSIKDVMS